MKASELISFAKTQVGYVGKKYLTDDLDEFEAPSGNGDYTKYARDLYKAGFYNGNKQGYDGWCTIGVDWCFYQVAGSKEEADKVNPIGSLGAGAKWAYLDYKNQGLTVDIPAYGDRFFLMDKNGQAFHVGLVIGVDTHDQTIYTLEFNGPADVVLMKSRSYANENIAFGRPKYEPEDIPEYEVGDIVKLKNGAYVCGTNYNFSKWVYGMDLYVRAVSDDKTTISTQETGAVTGSAYRQDLILVKKKNPPEPEPDPEPVDIYAELKKTLEAAKVDLENSLRLINEALDDLEKTK